MGLVKFPKGRLSVSGRRALTFVPLVEDEADGVGEADNRGDGTGEGVLETGGGEADDDEEELKGRGGVVIAANSTGG